MQSATVKFVFGVIEDLPLLPSFIPFVPFVPFVVRLCLDTSHLQTITANRGSIIFLLLVTP